MNEVIFTDKAPNAIGPYSQAVKTGNMIMTSGQIAIVPETGRLAGGIAEQTRQALTNLRAILNAAGFEMDDVVKTTVFLHDMDDFAAMNEVYAEFFTAGSYPARSAVQVARLPKDALVEIEATASK